MPTFSSTGRDGVPRIFDYRVTNDALAGKYTYRVQTQPAPVTGDFFELVVSVLDASTVRVEMVSHFNRSEYIGMGIPETILPIVKRELGMAVVSSPTRGTGNVYRTAAATKYWERLRKTGGATYDSARDVYSVV